MFDTITITGFADEIDESLEKQIEVIKKLGIRHIEMRGVNGKGLVEYSLSEVREIKKQLDQEGIHLSAIGSPIGKIKISDPFEPHFALFKHTVEIAKIMDTPYIRMFSFFIPQDEKPEQYREEVMRRMEQFVNYAKQEQVILLHENEKEIYGDTAPRCLEIMEQFYGEHLKAVFDFANFVQCEENTLEAFELLKPYIAYIHVKDAVLHDHSVVPAGMGDGNVEEILLHLKQSEYQGYLSLEPHLQDFTGFSELEQGAKGKETGSDGEMAFTTAYLALKNILDRI